MHLLFYQHANLKRHEKKKSEVHILEQNHFLGGFEHFQSHMGGNAI